MGLGGVFLLEDVNVEKAIYLKEESSRWLGALYPAFPYTSWSCIVLQEKLDWDLKRFKVTFSRVGVKEMEKKIAFSEVVDYLYREKKKGAF